MHGGCAQLPAQRAKHRDLQRLDDDCDGMVDDGSTCRRSETAAPAAGFCSAPNATAVTCSAGTCSTVTRAPPATRTSTVHRDGCEYRCPCFRPVVNRATAWTTTATAPRTTPSSASARPARAVSGAARCVAAAIVRAGLCQREWLLRRVRERRAHELRGRRDELQPPRAAPETQQSRRQLRRPHRRRLQSANRRQQLRHLRQPLSLANSNAHAVRPELPRRYLCERYANVVRSKHGCEYSVRVSDRAETCNGIDDDCDAWSTTVRRRRRCVQRQLPGGNCRGICTTANAAASAGLSWSGRRRRPARNLQRPRRRLQRTVDNGFVTATIR